MKLKKQYLYMSNKDVSEKILNDLGILKREFYSRY